MKAREILEAKDDKDINKPRNFVAKNAKMGGAGAHRDKKKEQKQGYEKHKGKDLAESTDLDSLINQYNNLHRQFDSYYEFSDDHSVWKKHHAIHNQLRQLHKQITDLGGHVEPPKSHNLGNVNETATAGATSSANIASVANPNVARSKRKVKSVNALDQNKVSLFGGPMESNEQAIIKRR